MQGWHTTFLGMRGLPRDISDFEMKAFFTFDGARARRNQCTPR
nr:conserved domain protein [uncultured bacterium]